MNSASTQSADGLGDQSHLPPADRIRIVSSAGIRGGRPRIDGHRITVDDVAIWHERLGMSPDEIVSAYPSISLSDVHAALAYYYEHRSDIDAAVAQSEKFVEELKAKSPPSLIRQKLIPCPYGFVIRSAGQTIFVRVECQSIDTSAVTLKRARFPAGLGIPQPKRFVT